MENTKTIDTLLNQIGETKDKIQNLELLLKQLLKTKNYALALLQNQELEENVSILINKYTRELGLFRQQLESITKTSTQWKK